VLKQESTGLAPWSVNGTRMFHRSRTAKLIIWGYGMHGYYCKTTHCTFWPRDHTHLSKTFRVAWTTPFRKDPRFLRIFAHRF